MESKIEEGEATWREEKARAQIEFDRFEAETCDELRKKEAAEENVISLNTRLLVRLVVLSSKGITKRA